MKIELINIPVAVEERCYLCDRLFEPVAGPWPAVAVEKGYKACCGDCAASGEPARDYGQDWPNLIMLIELGVGRR